MLLYWKYSDLIFQTYYIRSSFFWLRVRLKVNICSTAEQICSLLIRLSILMLHLNYFPFFFKYLILQSVIEEKRSAPFAENTSVIVHFPWSRTLHNLCFTAINSIDSRSDLEFSTDQQWRQKTERNSAIGAWMIADNLTSKIDDSDSNDDCYMDCIWINALPGAVEPISFWILSVKCT